MQIARLTNRSMSIVKSRPHAIEARNKMTKFLANPIKENLPPRIKTNVLSGGKVFICFAPDGKKIFVKTEYKSEVVLSIIYKKNRFFAELRAEHKGSRSIIQPGREVFLIKDEDRTYYSGLGLKEYRIPEIISKNLPPQKKIIYKHIESWLKNKAALPRPTLRKVNDKGRVPVCNYNGERIELPLGATGYAGKDVLEIFKDQDGFKYIYLIIEGKIWEFRLRCTDAFCRVRPYRGPSQLCNTEINKA